MYIYLDIWLFIEERDDSRTKVINRNYYSDNGKINNEKKTKRLFFFFFFFFFWLLNSEELPTKNQQ